MPPTKTTTFNHRFYSGWPKFTAGLLAASLGLIALQTPCALASPSETVIHGELTQLNQQVEKLYGEGQYLEALPLAEKQLAISEKNLGSNHPNTAACLNNLAGIYRGMGAYTKTELLYQRALAIWEKALGPEHPHTATGLNNLAELYREMGAYAKAEPLYLRALTIIENASSAKHHNIVLTLNNIATLYQEMGAYGYAERFYLRAKETSEKSLGAMHPYTALILQNLALLYQAMGAYDKAEMIFKKALAIYEKALNPDHPDMATILNNLAMLYWEKGSYDKAEPFNLRSFSILEKVLGAWHPNTAISINNTANLFSVMRAYDKAEPLYQRALSILEKSLGSEHHKNAVILNSLGVLYHETGKYDEAELFHQRALAIREKTGGLKHPDSIESLYNLAMVFWAEERWSDALNAFKRTLDNQESISQQILALGDEIRKKAYAENLSRYDSYVSFSFNAGKYINNSDILGLEMVLMRKGRVLEAMADTVGLLRQHLTPANQALLDELATLRTQQAALSNRGPGNMKTALYRAEVDKLNARAETLENTLSTLSAEFRSQFQPVTLERVQAALPKDSALVELVVYSPFNPKASKQGDRWGKLSYAAFVLQPSGKPKGIILGEVKEIDALVEDWRKALSNPHDDSVRSNRGVGVADSQDKLGAATHAGHLLYAKLIKPLLPLIGDSKTLFIAPDGDLNLVPLGALPDETGHYLLETHEINYLTSGRDMLKWSLPAKTAKQPVVLASPDFGSIAKKHKEPVQLAANDQGRRSNEYTRGKFHFDPLSGTAEEAKELSKLLTDGTVLTGAEATETALKDLHSPRILHLATHGFFLPDQPAEKPDAKTAMLSLDGQRPLPPSKNENPLLRSGIALAGANELQSGNEDGVLTALEASGLDLWGTQLVVLSACETGIGKVANGEGVYGLRRALVNAGAQSQVVSLWKVDDAATRDLMVDYYKRLLAGAGRAEALRQTQLAMLNSKDRNHPYYWAAFIASGDVRPIDKK